MAIFKGTNQEFRRYFGPRLRNLVQQITRNHKTNVGACEHCGSTDSLESAHVRGRERNTLIDIIASSYTTGDLVKVDLAEFEERFKAEHQPNEKSILILCRPCHLKYDSRHLPPNNGQARSRGDLLPITLSHTPPSAFRSRLLVTKKAEIQIHYSNGRVESKPWAAQRLRPTSNVMGNLRSRPEFRAGTWQERGIVKVHVKIVDA
jgi:hypothetical protein